MREPWANNDKVEHAPVQYFPQRQLIALSCYRILKRCWAPGVHRETHAKMAVVPRAGRSPQLASLISMLGPLLLLLLLLAAPLLLQDQASAGRVSLVSHSANAGAASAAASAAANGGAAASKARVHK